MDVFNLYLNMYIVHYVPLAASNVNFKSHNHDKVV
jgi:hypothetical protein